MKIVKKSFSVNPWRLIDSQGRQINAGKVVVEDGDGNKLAIESIVSGATKKECTEKALALFEKYIDFCDKLNLDIISKALIGPDRQYPRILFYVPVDGSSLSAQASVDFDSFAERDYFLSAWRKYLKSFLETGGIT